MSLEPTSGEIGQTIQRLRTARGLTQEGLARAANLTVTTIGRVERGENFPETRTLALLAAALGSTVAELLGEMGEPIEPEPDQPKAAAG
jgi:transcriptional regulator with XRE-family HTH domain